MVSYTSFSTMCIVYIRHNLLYLIAGIALAGCGGGTDSVVVSAGVQEQVPPAVAQPVAQVNSPPAAQQTVQPTVQPSVQPSVPLSVIASGAEYDTRIGLGADAAGIPILEKHANARYIYWNPSHRNASDNNAGTQPEYPKRTLPQAWNALRDGFGDWLLMAQTAPAQEQGLSNPADYNKLTSKSGLSARYPIVVTTYDPSDPTNTAKMRKGRVTVATNPTGLPLNLIGYTGSKIVFENLKFDLPAGNKDKDIKYWNGEKTHQLDLLFHNVIFRNTQATIQGGDGGVTPNRATNVIYRHCALYEGMNQGMYLWKTDGVTVEDSVFFHNGWTDDGTRDSASRRPNIYDHNAYFGTTTYNTIFRRNVSGHSSAAGLQLRGGGIVVDNVFASNPISLLIGGGDNYNTYRPDGVPYYVKNNVIVGSSDINSQIPRGFGLLFENTMDGGTFDKNLIVNIGPLSTGNKIALVSSWLSEQFDVPTYFNMTNNVIWNWNKRNAAGGFDENYSLMTVYNSRKYPNRLKFTYSDNVIEFDTAPTGTNKRVPLTPYPSPNRTVATYATESGYADEKALWVQMINNPQLPWAATISNYIREGFGAD